MIREITEKDRKIYLELSEEFYSSPAVSHKIDIKNCENAFEETLKGSPYIKIFMFEADGKPVGYGQVSFTYSIEAGGLTLWLEEAYVKPEYRSRGLGSEFFEYVFYNYGKVAKRYRLEIDPDNLRAEKLYVKKGFSDMPYKPMVKENF